MLVRGSEIHEDTEGAVLAPVVHVDDLPAKSHRPDMTSNLGMELRQVLLLVEDRNDQRELHCGSGTAALAALVGAEFGVSGRHSGCYRLVNVALTGPPPVLFGAWAPATIDRPGMRRSGRPLTLPVHRIGAWARTPDRSCG